VDHDARVRTSLLTAPRWVLVLVYGVPFGLWMGLFGRFAHHDSWTEALIGGVLAGLFFGIFMGMLTHLVLPARLRRRIELLRAEGTPAP